MAVPRAYVDQPLAGDLDLELPEEVANHIVRVLRLRAGAMLTLFNGRGGEYAATLLFAGTGRGARTTVRVGAHSLIERESPLQVTLLQGIARGERMDYIIQKATELGVTRIVPLSTGRSVVRLDGAAGAKRLEHWRGIAIAACEQCGRNRLPQIDAVTEIARVAEVVEGETTRVLLHPEAPVALATATSALRSVALLIGPEGGLAEPEVARARGAGFQLYRLGPRVLRTETAPLAALAVLQLMAGDLGS